MEIWEKIVKANNEIETIKLKSKSYNKKTKQWDYKVSDYAEVKERVIAFRKVFPLGTIETDIETTETSVIAKTKVFNDNQLIATGYAREPLYKIIEKQKVANQYAYEVAESSSCGRALGFAGFGIKGSISTAEDISNMKDEDVFDEDTEATKKKQEELIAKFNKLGNTQKANILNLFHTTDVKTINADVLEELIRNAK